MNNLADKITEFLFHLKFPLSLPEGVAVLDVYQNHLIQDTCRHFYKKFYSDSHPRHIILGINPGRFGGGITGIPFTDPIRLEKDCGIPNIWPRKQELSSVYMYEMIAAYGGPEKFYHDLYINSISPVGFTSNGKNLNYYDHKQLSQQIEPFAVSCLQLQLKWGLRTKIAFCIGEGKNYQYLQKMNAQHHFFKQIIPLSHPRFIMQYKSKEISCYIDQYLTAFAHITH